MLIPESEFNAVAFIEGDKSVKVLAQPDLNAKIVTLLNPGVQAMVVGRTETGDWISVNVLGIYGWIYTEMIVLNVDMEKIVFVNPMP